MSFLSNLFSEKHTQTPWFKLAIFFGFSMFTMSNGFLRRITRQVITASHNRYIKARALAGEKFSIGYSSISAPPNSMQREDQPCLNPIDQNSVVLVIGGTRGLGIEFVKQLLVKKATVVATYRSPPNDLKALNSQRLVLLQMDVSDERSIKEAAKQYKRQTIGEFTHIIHNAGVYGDRDAQTFGNVDTATMVDVMKINTIAPLIVVQEFLPLCVSPKKNNGSWPVIAIMSSKVGSIDDNKSGNNYIYRCAPGWICILFLSFYPYTNRLPSLYSTPSSLPYTLTLPML